MVASCSERRASSSCSRSSARRFSDLTSSRRSYSASMEPNCCSSWAAVFSPTPGHAGDVVRGVALEPDVVGDLRRRDAEALEHGRRRVDLDVGDAAAGAHHPDVVVDHLHGVAVAGDDDRADALALGLLGQRAEDVVGLVARLDRLATPKASMSSGRQAPLLREQVRHAADAAPCTARTPRRGRSSRARPRRTTMHAGRYSLTILSSIWLRPKSAFVGMPGRVEMDFGQREEGAEREAAAVEQEEAVVRGAGRPCARFYGTRRQALGGPFAAPDGRRHAPQRALLDQQHARAQRAARVAAPRRQGAHEVDAAAAGRRRRTARRWAWRPCRRPVSTTSTATSSS